MDHLSFSLDVGSEMASEMYVDEVVDGQGIGQMSREGLTPLVKCVTLDSDRSVSGLIRFDYPEEVDGCERSLEEAPPPQFLRDLWEGMVDHG